MAKRIVAIYKDAESEEFIRESIDSICRNVSTIIIPGKMDIGKFDGEADIYHLGTGPKEPTVPAALKWVFDQEIAFDFLMLVGSGDVFEKLHWHTIDRYLEEEPDSVFICEKARYLKSPFYLIDEPKMTTFVFYPYESVRFGLETDAQNNKRTIMKNVIFHDFAMVKKSFEPYFRERSENWVRHIWNDERGIKIVPVETLPSSIQAHEITTAWLKYPDKKIRSMTNRTPPKEPHEGLPADFGPNHPDWNIPSKRNRYFYGPDNTEKEKNESALPAPEQAPAPAAPGILTPAQINRQLARMQFNGSLAIVTIVSGAYQWYAPLFLDRIKKEVPGAVPMVFIRGENTLPEKWKVLCKTDDALNAYPPDGYTTAALRFVFDYPGIEEFDYTLITDIDMLLRENKEEIIHFHMRALKRDNLDCYDNYVSAWIDGKPKMPGVHFVIREWWGKTIEARKAHRDFLEIHGAKMWDYDERMIGDIVQRSGLRFTELPRLWAHSGIHLGDYRRRLQKKFQTPGFNAHEQLQIIKMLRDDEFMKIVAECSEHLDTEENNCQLQATFELFRKAVM